MKEHILSVVAIVMMLIITVVTFYRLPLIRQASFDAGTKAAMMSVCEADNKTITVMIDSKKVCEFRKFPPNPRKQ